MTNTNENNMNSLQELGGSNFEMANGKEDIRGWDVRNAAGQRLGDVEDLLFDETSQKIRYIILDMDDNEVHLTNQKVLIPIGLAELDIEEDDVILSTVTIDQLKSLAEYDKDNLNREGNKMDMSVFADADALENQNVSYQSNHFDDSKLYRNRLAMGNTQNQMPENSSNDEEIIKQNHSNGINLRSKDGIY